jgi:hypothetical protein
LKFEDQKNERRESDVVKMTRVNDYKHSKDIRIRNGTK